MRTENSKFKRTVMEKGKGKGKDKGWRLSQSGIRAE